MRFFLSLLFSIVAYSAVSGREQTSAGMNSAIAYKEDSIHPTGLVPGKSYSSLPGNAGDEERNPIIFTPGKLLMNRMAFAGVLGISKKGRPVQAYFFPGSSEKKALVIGGVHGSELSAIELAKNLVKEMQTQPNTYYNVVIIPCLFPDNEIAAMLSPDGTRKQYNSGRYSSKNAVDPNRQMPAPGKAFNIEIPVDFHGRPIEEENKLLLQLIHEYQPDRVINLHAIREVKHAGIFADPRTDYQGYALDYETDSSLAIEMAKYIYEQGGNVAGNHLDSTPTTLYHNDPEIVAEGSIQKRNLEGSRLPSDRGQGISLGAWASTAVCDSINEVLSRPAMRLLTVEYPGYKRVADYADPAEISYHIEMVQLYTHAIRNIFLSRAFEETGIGPCYCKNKPNPPDTLLTDNH